MRDKIAIAKKFIIVGVISAVIGFAICFFAFGTIILGFNSQSHELFFDSQPFGVFFIGMIFVASGVGCVKLTLLFFGLSLNKADIGNFLEIFRKK